MDFVKNEYHLLKKIFDGVPIGIALETLKTELGLAEDELATNISGWFARWMRNGLLAYNVDSNNQNNRTAA